MLSLAQLDASFVAEFLDNLESSRDNGARSRNARLASLRSFYHFAAFEAPQHAGIIQRVLAIPYKRLTRRLVNYLTRPELEAVLASVDKSTWIGRRNHAMLLLATQTGLRLSEITGLRQRDVVLGRGAHVRCEGKGRKERCTPLAKPTVAVLKSWIKEQGDDESRFLSDGRDVELDWLLEPGRPFAREQGTTVFPYLWLRTMSRRWVKEHHLLQYGGLEDVQLGWDVDLKVGPAGGFMGSSTADGRQRWRFETVLQRWMQLGPGYGLVLGGGELFFPLGVHLVFLGVPDEAGPLAGRYGQAARNQVVPGVARGHFLDVAGDAEVRDVLLKDDFGFHGAIPPCRATGPKRGRA